MTFWPFALVVLGYLLIGALLAGLFDVEDEMGLWCLFWPFFVGMFGIVLIVVAPFEISKWIKEKISKKIKKLENKKKEE